MASALKCDRCGKLYEEYAGCKLVEGGCSYNGLSVENRIMSRRYDLCPECMEKLVEFIRGYLNKEVDDV